MGYQSMPVQALIETLPPTTGTAMSLSTNWDDVKSEDEDEPLSLAQGFTSFTVIKMMVHDGQTLTHQVTTTNKENVPSTPVGQPPQPPVSMVHDELTPGPYSPKGISLYGHGASTYYMKEMRFQEAEGNDDKFGMTIHGVPYPLLQVYQYPDAHPNLRIFPCSELQVMRPSTAPAVNTSMWKEHTATPVPSVHAPKILKPIVPPCLCHQIQLSPNDPKLNHLVHGTSPSTTLKIVMLTQELGWNIVMHRVFMSSLMRTC
ncbi:hypothetical protein K443DRAFT_132277 [Laccaria amethystina LaAM-08-1]|uniref:Uncharacterized protein n=1 Tax=Laccaria amethystina LaAM-08-1 TaxID=1095629 RepID=A0A0C9XVA1_9AGAR|nr:hypothetical protein K443DRAFT_132277 [Laccaria amethystina LaAM-08-1]